MIAYVDGGCRNNGNREIASGYASYRIIGNEIIDNFRFYLGDAKTNNESEYLAVIELMQDEYFEPGSHIYSDSQLIVGQLSLGWKVKAKNLKPLYKQARGLMKLRKYTIEWVPREEIEARLGH